MSSVTVAVGPVIVVVALEANSREWRRFVGVSLPSSLLAPRPLSAPAVELLPPGEWLRRWAAAPAARGSSKNDTVGLTSRLLLRIVAHAGVIASDVICIHMSTFQFNYVLDHSLVSFFSYLLIVICSPTNGDYLKTSRRICCPSYD